MMLEGLSRKLAPLVGIVLAAGIAAATSASVPARAERGARAHAGTELPATALVVFGTDEEADTVFAEVARTEEERARGLMFRERLEENAGMLFVLPNYEAISFWMKDTYIPLDVAFMDPTFRITGIRELEPESEELVDSPGPIQFALEVNRGWFEEHGVRVDDRARVFFGG